MGAWGLWLCSRPCEKLSGVAAVLVLLVPFSGARNVLLARMHTQVCVIWSAGGRASHILVGVMDRPSVTGSLGTSLSRARLRNRPSQPACSRQLHYHGPLSCRKAS